jgi:mono/diheme cytochrome c family protein
MSRAITNTDPRNRAASRAIGILLAIAAAAASPWSHAADSGAAAPKAGSGDRHIRWAKVRVELPRSQAIFPPGDGADIANAQCLICHSAGMVLRQPALTREQWAAEIAKMRSDFGAPLPADQIDRLVTYLHQINGRPSGGVGASR